MRPAFGRLTPSQEAIYSFVSTSRRWLTAYEISMLTGVLRATADNAIRELRKAGFVSVRKRIGGFDNGDNEFRATSPTRVANMCVASRVKFQTDRITGVEPLAKRLRRILGKAKAEMYSEFIE